MTSLNALQLLILERTANGTNSTILNGLPGKVRYKWEQWNVYVFDAAVIVSGYVSGHIWTQDYVLNKLSNYMPWLHISFRIHPGIADD